MKNNKEFLEGVYRKAEILEKEKISKQEPKRSIPYKKYIRFASVAAIFIILPLLFLNSGIMTPYTDIGIHQPRIMTINDPMSNYLGADFIIIGETKEIENSVYVEEGNYISTDVIIAVDQVLLGEIENDVITVRVNGGKVKKAKVLSQMEGDFNKDERSILFLYKGGEDIYSLVNNGDGQFKEIEKDIFTDKFGDKYTLEDIKDYIDRR